MIKGEGIVIPGARKSGTSTLYRLLVNSKKVYKPSSKEPQFFSLRKKEINDNIDWYIKSRKKRMENEKYWIDASTFYLFDKEAPRKISTFTENPKIVIVLRDPVERTYSAFLEMYKKVYDSERRSFSKIVRRIHNGVRNGRSIEETESKLLSKAARAGKIDDDYLDKGYLSRKTTFPGESVFEDKTLVFRYFTNSMYNIHVERFKEQFANVKVITLSELSSETHKVIDELSEFLEIELSINDSKAPKKNETVLPKNRLVKNLKKMKRYHSNVDSLLSKIFKYSGLEKYLSSVIYDKKQPIRNKDKEIMEKIFSHSRKYKL